MPLGTGVQLRSAAYLGWRMPTLNELFRPFRVSTASLQFPLFLQFRPYPPCPVT